VDCFDLHVTAADDVWVVDRELMILDEQDNHDKIGELK
jgi:hypothetical protein